MREIKFRQPLFKPNGEFFKFHYWGDTNGGFISPVAGNLGRNSQEYTGRKDKAGNDVYEGDFIKEGGRISTVRFSKSYARFELETPTGRAGLYGFYGGIVGNVYENVVCTGGIEVKHIHK